MYVKPTNAAAIRGLNDAELDTVSGGVGTSGFMKAVAAAALAGAGMPAGPHDDGVLPTLPCDSFDIICRILP